MIEHKCEEMKKEIEERGEDIEIKKIISWNLNMGSTDDNYISAHARIHYCPWCGVKLE